MLLVHHACTYIHTPSFHTQELPGDCIDFGHQFVGRPFTKSVTVHNMGRKPATLSWASAKRDEVQKAFAKTARMQGNKFDMSLVPQEARVSLGLGLA